MKKKFFVDASVFVLILRYFLSLFYRFVRSFVGFYPSSVCSLVRNSDLVILHFAILSSYTSLTITNSLAQDINSD
jgi:hypothetical protein